MLKRGSFLARTVNEQKHAMKQNEILDAFQRLVVTKGYEQTAIQDILDELGISKGAFYHYFSSKQALLDSFIDRSVGETEKALMLLAQDARLSALEKLNRFFPTISQLKVERLDFWLAVMRVWYNDSNAIVRDKVNSEVVRRLVPLMAIIIRQGVDEGVMTTGFPDEVSEVILTLVQGLSNVIARMLLEHSSAVNALEKINTWISAYTELLERVLGTSKDAIHLISPGAIDSWLTPSLMSKEP